MKTALFLLTSLLAGLLSACATTSDTARRAAPAHQEVKFVVDTDFMREYEAAARRRSIVQVHWVNPPTKRVVVE